MKPDTFSYLFDFFYFVALLKLGERNSYDLP